MTDTFLALLIAHLMADFVAQTDAMVRYKRNPAVFALHIALVFALTVAALGGAPALAAAVAAAHGIFDALKTWALPARHRDGLTAFLADQGAHLATLALAAAALPAAAATGLWAPHLDLARGPAILACGALVAVLAGGHAVGALMRPYARQRATEETPLDSLENAGRLIGQLERALIFLLVLIGEPGGIGFLIAAKSILRFDTASEGQRASEYVIIGTLASFGWALAAAYATQACLETLA